MAEDIAIDALLAISALLAVQPGSCLPILGAPNRSNEVADQKQY